MKKILLIIAILLLTGCSSYQKSKMVEGLYHTVNPDFIPPNRDQIRLGFSENECKVVKTWCRNKGIYKSNPGHQELKFNEETRQFESKSDSYGCQCIY